MRTTIDLPDDLFRQVKARAALDGLKLKELITRYVEQGLRQGAPPAADVDGKQLHQGRRGDLPEMIPARGRRIPALSNADLLALLDNEDAPRGATSHNSAG